MQNYQSLPPIRAPEADIYLPTKNKKTEPKDDTKEKISGPNVAIENRIDLMLNGVRFLFPFLILAND